MKCKVCGEDAVEVDFTTILTSLPPQYRTTCKKCGHIDSIPCSEVRNGTNGDNWGVDHYDPNQNPTFISMPYEKPSIYQQGWVCPKCGAVMSPSTDQCPNCRPKNRFTC